MQKQFHVLQSGKDEYYYDILAMIILLIGFGLVMLYSTSSYTAGIQRHDDMYYFRRQGLICLGMLAGIVIFTKIFPVDYHILERLAFGINIAALVLMLLVRFTALGLELNGARRWIDLGGITFQPSELSKIAVLTYTPVLIKKMGRHYKGVKAAVTAMVPALVQAAATYLLTRNLSTAIIIFLIGLAIVFVAHPKTLGFLIFVGGVLAFAAMAVLQVAAAGNGSGGSFRFMRIKVWLNPELYASSGGYQILQGLYALGSGGFLGKGLGNSTQKLGALPEAQNDMIFSIICEELGILGAVIVLILFGALLYRLFFVAENAPDLYGSLMVVGIFAHIASQVILNIAVALNLIPTTGVTLPFISYGGTSIVFLMIEMAVALSVARRIRPHKRKRDLWGEVVG